MSWEEAPPRGRAKPSMVAVVILVTVGAALALATGMGDPADDRMAVDSDADSDADADAEEPAIDEADGGESRAGDDQDGFGADPDDGREEAEPTEEQGEGEPTDGDAERTGPTEERTLPGDTGLQVFLQTHRGQLARIDLDTGELVETGQWENQRPDLDVIGDLLLFGERGRIMGLDADLEGEADVIVEGHWLYPANEEEGWVVQHGQVMEAVKVRVSDGEEIARHELPPHSQIRGVHGDEVILELLGHISAQDFGSGEGRSIGSGTMVAYRNGRVAWLDCGADMGCDLVTSDLDGGEELRVGGDWLAQTAWHDSALSPSGDILLAPIEAEGGGLAIAAASTSDGSITEIALPSGHPERIEWAPDGSWAFVAISTGSLLAWSPADGETMVLRHGLDGVVAIAVR